MTTAFIWLHTRSNFATWESIHTFIPFRPIQVNFWLWPMVVVLACCQSMAGKSVHTGSALDAQSLRWPGWQGKAKMHMSHATVDEPYLNCTTLQALALSTRRPSPLEASNIAVVKRKVLGHLIDNGTPIFSCYLLDAASGAYKSLLNIYRKCHTEMCSAKITKPLLIIVLITLPVNQCSYHQSY